LRKSTNFGKYLKSWTVSKLSAKCCL